MLNKVILIGNVGQDPDVRVMQNGTKVANFSVATSESWKDKSGERKESVEWHRICVYSDALAGMIERSVKKGAKVYVEGSIRTRKYTDHSGNEKSVSEIVVHGFSATIRILDSGNRGGKSDNGFRSNNNESGKHYEPEENYANDSTNHEVDDTIPF